MPVSDELADGTNANLLGQQAEPDSNPFRDYTACGWARWYHDTLPHVLLQPAICL
jgi:hypothetical protein